MTITEAGACGTPAVVSDIAGHRDALAHGVSGLLVEPGDEFVDALVQGPHRRGAAREPGARCRRPGPRPHLGSDRGHRDGCPRRGDRGPPRRVRGASLSAGRRRTSSTTGVGARNTMAVHTSTLAGSNCDGHPPPTKKCSAGLRHEDVDDGRGGEAHHGQPSRPRAGARAAPGSRRRPPRGRWRGSAGCGTMMAATRPHAAATIAAIHDGHRLGGGEGARERRGSSRSTRSRRLADRRWRHRRGERRAGLGPQRQRHTGRARPGPDDEERYVLAGLRCPLQRHRHGAPPPWVGPAIRWRSRRSGWASPGSAHCRRSVAFHPVLMLCPSTSQYGRVAPRDPQVELGGRRRRHPHRRRRPRRGGGEDACHRGRGGGGAAPGAESRASWSTSRPVFAPGRGQDHVTSRLRG